MGNKGRDTTDPSLHKRVVGQTCAALPYRKDDSRQERMFFSKPRLFVALQTEMQS